MNELLIIGGIYTILLIVFHLLFWRIFRWPQTLEPLNRVNRSTMQVLNISITFIFCIFAYVSLAHTDELLSTPLGRSLIAWIALLWLFRALLQVLFYRLKHSLSIFLAVYFLLGSMLYGIPAFNV